MDMVEYQPSAYARYDIEHPLAGITRYWHGVLRATVAARAQNLIHTGLSGVRGLDRARAAVGRLPADADVSAASVVTVESSAVLEARGRRGCFKRSSHTCG